MMRVCLEATGRGLAGSAWKVRLAINGPEAPVIGAKGLRRLGFRVFVGSQGFGSGLYRGLWGRRWRRFWVGLGELN